MPAHKRTINHKQLTVNKILKKSVVSCRRRRPAFTLVELLIVIAILGILAAAVMVAINPGKRTAQARDAQRKSDVNAIANALVGYYTFVGRYPNEFACDTSRGSTGLQPVDTGSSGAECQNFVTGSDWTEVVDPGFGDDQLIYPKLVVAQQFLKRLPKDPKNNSTFYYKYEPSGEIKSPDTPPKTHSCWYINNRDCTKYWIGVRLESVDNPSEIGRRVFRCSDDTSLPAGAGCKEILFDQATGILSFDFSHTTY